MKNRILAILLSILLFCSAFPQAKALSAAQSCAGKAVLAKPEVTAGHVESTGKPKLTWINVPGADCYRVYRAQEKNGTYQLMKTTQEYSYVNLSALPGETYYYKVTAVSADRTVVSPFSAVRSITCDLPAPAAKGSHDADSGRITITWKAVAGALSYRVYRAEDPNGPWKCMKTTTELSYLNTASEVGKPYWYRVRATAKNTRANSACSPAMKLTRRIQRPLVSISLSSTGHPYLTWTPISGAVRYRIYRSEEKNGKYTLIRTTTNLFYTNNAAAAGHTYYYKIVAVSDLPDANSSNSKVRSITAQ